MMLQFFLSWSDSSSDTRPLNLDFMFSLLLELNTVSLQFSGGLHLYQAVLLRVEGFSTEHLKTTQAPACAVMFLSLRVTELLGSVEALLVDCEASE